MNQFQTPNESVLTITCERATIQCLMHENRWRWHETAEQPWQDGSSFDVARDDLFVAQANMLIDSVEEDTSPTCTLAEGLQTLKVNLAMLQASDTGMWQTIE